MSDKKVVLITGASSGIGLDAANTMLKMGYRVYGTSRNPEKHACAFPLLKLDAATDRSVAACYKAFMKQENRLDILINNAGLGLRGAFEEISMGEAVQLFDANFFGVMRMVKKALPIMREQSSGMIINLSSILGLVGLPFNSLYCATKFAIEGLSQVLRLEVAQFGIKVALINPGRTRTGFSASAMIAEPMEEYSDLRETSFDRIKQASGSAPKPEIVTKAILEAIKDNATNFNYLVGDDTKKILEDKESMPLSRFEDGMRETFGI